jgi:hypothetical protein
VWAGRFAVVDIPVVTETAIATPATTSPSATVSRARDVMSLSTVVPRTVRLRSGVARIRSR